jgi:hypothetical protein
MLIRKPYNSHFWPNLLFHKYSYHTKHYEKYLKAYLSLAKINDLKMIYLSKPVTLAIER